MRHLTTALLFTLSLSTGLQAQESTSQERLPDLLGIWIIDLRPSPDSDPYFQELKIEEIGTDSFSGTFYGSDIRDVQTNTQWSKLHFAFTTSDNTHDYYHIGYLENGVLTGTSYCPGRGFVQPWAGEKK